MERIREMVQQWKAEAAREGRPLKLPTSKVLATTSSTSKTCADVSSGSGNPVPFMLRNIWTAGLVLFGCLMMSTFFITKVWQATVMIALVGICWAIACWV